MEDADSSDASVWAKASNVLALAIPTMVTMVIHVSQMMVNLIFVGRLNNPAMLAGVGMGNITQNFFALTIAYGLNGTLESLISQAYGAGNLDLCGVYLNRSRVVLLAFMAPMLLILLNTESLLTLIGQDKVSAGYA